CGLSGVRRIRGIRGVRGVRRVRPTLRRSRLSLRRLGPTVTTSAGDALLETAEPVEHLRRITRPARHGTGGLDLTSVIRGRAAGQQLFTATSPRQPGLGVLGRRLPLRHLLNGLPRLVGGELPTAAVRRRTTARRVGDPAAPRGGHLVEDRRRLGVLHSRLARLTLRLGGAARVALGDGGTPPVTHRGTGGLEQLPAGQLLTLAVAAITGSSVGEPEL